MTISVTTCPNCGAALNPGVSFCRRCGRPVSAEPQPSAERLQSRSMRSGPRWRRRYWGRLVIGVAIVGTLAAAAAIYVSQEVTYTPDEPVRDWFAALTASDTSAAAALR